MLVRSQLEELARTFTDGNTDHAEKLYLQDIVLHSIYQNITDELVFKRGTALLKLHNLDRFSEDLDFTATKEIDLEKILNLAVAHLENFGAEVDKIESEQNEDSFNTRLGIQGPLYTGNELSLSFIRIEVNKKTGAKNTELRRYTPKFPDIPTFQILALTQEENLAEKFRALMTRNRPRDLYDIYHLLSKGVEIDSSLVQEKLDYYSLDFDPQTALEHAEKARKNWDDLQNLVFSQLPDFETVTDLLQTKLESTS